MSDVAVVVTAFLIAFTVSATATPLLRLLALRHGFVDRPSARRAGPLQPRLGGVAMYLAFVAAVAVTAPFVEERTGEELRKVIGILLGGALVCAIGAVDDRRELSFRPLGAVQLAAAGVAVGFGIVIDQLTNPFGTPLSESMVDIPYFVAVGFTVFWIVGAINTINFIDGLDGLAAGVTAIASIVFFVHAWRLDQHSVALLPLALAGCSLGFLLYNFYPARIIMGTSGAFFLGYALATISVLGGTKAATLLLVLGVPIVDTAWIVVGRVMSGHSPFHGDRTHLHHRLMQLGMGPPQIVLTFYLLCGGLGALALVLSSRLAKLYVLLGMALLLTAALVVIAQRSIRSKA